MKIIKKIFIFLLLTVFLTFIAYEKPLYGEISYRVISYSLLGVSVLAGFGANYLRKESISKFNEAEQLHDDYKALPDKLPNLSYEEAYEKYEDKYTRADQFKSYYYICLIGSGLSFAGAIVLFFKSPSSNNKTIDFGYNMNFYNGNNDLYVKMKF